VLLHDVIMTSYCCQRYAECLVTTLFQQHSALAHRAAHGKTVSNNVDMADEFNQFFTSVYTKEDIAYFPTPKGVFQGSVTDRLNDVLIDQYLIKRNLLKLRTDKAGGPDNLSPWFLRKVDDEIATLILLLMRESLDEGTVPMDWKTANISPIYKKGDRSSVSNYRPISLTSQICKVIEAVLRNALVAHLEHNQLIHDSQHGFRKGRSCLNNLLTFLDKVTEYMITGNSVDVIYLDFAKAFDTVPHQRLLEKLKAHGIGGKLWNWIKSWLSGRLQRVCIKGKASDWTRVVSGVLQGSVLGPVLFLINDLEEGIENWILKFADDTKIFSKTQNTEDCERLQKDLNQLL